MESVWINPLTRYGSVRGFYLEMLTYAGEFFVAVLRGLTIDDAYRFSSSSVQPREYMCLSLYLSVRVSVPVCVRVYVRTYVYVCL